jgi:hypothetical protein
VRRLLLTAVGLALCSASLVVLCVSIYELGHVGSCASGGVYVSVRPCPRGSEIYGLLIPACIFGGLLGVALYHAGGMRRREPRSRVPLPVWMWSLLFLGIAGSLALAAFGPTAIDGSGVTTAAIVLLVVFVPMGLVPLVVALAGAGRPSRGPAPPKIRIEADGVTVVRVADEDRPAPSGSTGAKPIPGTGSGARAAGTPPPRPSTGRAPTAGDIVEHLERLAALRASGAITPEEFDRLKAALVR